MGFYGAQNFFRKFAHETCVNWNLYRLPTVISFNLCLDEVIRKWLKKLKTNKYFQELIFNTLLFADDQFIISDTEDNLQRAVYSLYNI